MKKSLLLIASLLVGCMLAACGTPTPPPPEIRYQTKVVAPADNLLADCDIESPPPVDEYKVKTADQKEEAQTDLNSKNINNLVKCNDRMKNIRDWKTDQLGIYKDQKP